MVLDVTAIGTVHRRKILTRAGARAGDEVYVTGTLGDAAAGLLRLQSGPRRCRRRGQISAARAPCACRAPARTKPRSHELYGPQ